jgi:hypothetical protein
MDREVGDLDSVWHLAWSMLTKGKDSKGSQSYGDFKFIRNLGSTSTGHVHLGAIGRRRVYGIERMHGDGTMTTIYKWHD